MAHAGGRPKGSKAVYTQEYFRKLVKKHKVVERLVQLTASDNETIAMKSSMFLFEHAYGKAVQPVSGPEGGPIQTQVVVNLVHADPQDNG